MSGRLASLYSPSTPSPKPVRPNAKATKQYSASSQSTTESTYHRKTRALLTDLRVVVRTWEDLVMHDGIKAARNLVDLRTELNNDLAALPSGTQPRRRLVGPKLLEMDEQIADLEVVVYKLERQFNKMNVIVTGMETNLIEASKSKGWQWVSQEPLWCTWTLEKFVNTLPTLIPPYHRSLHEHRLALSILQDHSSSFEACREALEEWAAQPALEGELWDELDDIFRVEVEKWD